jgi:hypothetical protein
LHSNLGILLCQNFATLGLLVMLQKLLAEINNKLLAKVNISRNKQQKLTAELA